MDKVDRHGPVRRALVMTNCEVMMTRILKDAQRESAICSKDRALTSQDICIVSSIL